MILLYVFRYGRYIGTVAVPKNADLRDYFDFRLLNKDGGFNIALKPTLSAKTLEYWRNA